MVELLAVMVIIGIVTAVSLPALASLNNAGNVNQATNGVSLLLNECRAYAMAHNTYVWVGFLPNATTQSVTVGAVAGKTGLAGDLAANAYVPVTKLRVYNNFIFDQTITPVVGSTATPVDISVANVGSFIQGTGSLQVTFGTATGWPLTSKPGSYPGVLQFDPQGEATIAPASGASHWIQIRMQPVHGGNTTAPNWVAFELANLSGQVQIVRP